MGCFSSKTERGVENEKNSRPVDKFEPLSSNDSDKHSMTSEVSDASDMPFRGRTGLRAAAHRTKEGTRSPIRDSESRRKEEENEKAGRDSPLPELWHHQIEAERDDGFDHDDEHLQAHELSGESYREGSGLDKNTEEEEAHRQREFEYETRPHRYSDWRGDSGVDVRSDYSSDVSSISSMLSVLHESPDEN